MAGRGCDLQVSHPGRRGSGGEGQGWRHKTRGFGFPGLVPQAKAWLLLEESRQDLEAGNDTPGPFTFGEGLSAAEGRGRRCGLGMKRLEAGGRWEGEATHWGMWQWRRDRGGGMVRKNRVLSDLHLT